MMVMMGYEKYAEETDTYIYTNKLCTHTKTLTKISSR